MSSRIFRKNGQRTYLKRRGICRTASSQRQVLIMPNPFSFAHQILPIALSNSPVKNFELNNFNKL